MADPASRTSAVVAFFASVLYQAWLINAGVLMLVLPWRNEWTILVLQMPMKMAFLFDTPAVRGLISGFGIAHLVLFVVEVIRAAREEQGG